MKKKQGLLIVFEGNEGSGKTTQIKKTAAFLRRKGKQVVMLREPGGTRVSEAIREVLLDKRNTKMVPHAELLLYLAARAQIVEEKIKPALEKGKFVICDRFESSTIAYQGYGRGLNTAAIEMISQKFVRGQLKPDLTVFLDIDPQKGLARGGRHDRMERQSMAFHRRVRGGFLKLAKKNPRKSIILDATLERGHIARLIQERLERVIT